MKSFLKNCLKFILFSVYAQAARQHQSFLLDVWMYFTYQFADVIDADDALLRSMLPNAFSRAAIFGLFVVFPSLLVAVRVSVISEILTKHHSLSFCASFRFVIVAFEFMM